MKFKIGKATVGDAEKIAELIKGMLLFTEKMGWHKVSRSSKNWEETVSRIRKAIKTDPEHFYLVASIEDKVIGFAEGLIVELPIVLEAKKTLHISAVFVEKEFRKNGIGEALIKRLIQLGKTFSAEEVDLGVHIKNPAIKLYSRIGFKIARSQMVMKI